MIETLFRMMDILVPVNLYPPQVVPVPARIVGTPFFPGGCGLYLEGAHQGTTVPFGGVMILGHNFDSEKGL